MEKRILALDIGDVRIGIAVSDPTRTIASPVEVLTRKGWGPDVRHIQSLCEQYNTDEILSGLPLNMDGTEGFQAKKVRDFCSQLEKSGLKVYYQDERLSTVTAEDALLEGKMTRQGRKSHVDKVAAAVILRQWLDELEQKEEKKMDYIPESNEEHNNIIELTADDGETLELEHLATLEYEGESYLVLCEPDDEADDNEDVEIYIMKISQDENGEDIYELPDDEELCQKVLDQYLQMLDETTGVDSDA